MSDGAPISQEIRLPTDFSDVTAATKLLDQLIGRVDKLEHANAHQHGEAKKHHEESEHGFKSLWETMGRVVKREAELAVGIRAVGLAGLQAKEHMTEFLEFIGAEAALDLFKELAEKVIDVGKEAIKSAAYAERMNFALDAAAGGGEAGENVRKWVEANAKFSEFTEAQNEAAYLRLRRFGVGNEKAGLYMKAAEDLAAMAAPGEREGVYNEGLEAFARLSAKGRLDARSAMRLGIGVEDLKTLPGFAGLSNEKVWQKAEKTNLDENTLLNLIVRHTGEKALGERAADASQLLLTKFTKLSELPELFYKRLGETGATKKLSQEIDVILDKLDPESASGKRIFGALETAFNSITTAIGEIDFESIADTITNDVLPAVTKMISLINPAINVIDKTMTGLHVLWRAGSDPLGAAGDVIAGKGIRKSALEQLGEQGRLPSQQDQPSLLKDLTGVTFVNRYLGGNYLRNTVLNPEWWHTSGKAAGEGYAQGMNEAGAGVTDAAMSMGESSHESLMSSIDAHSPSRLFAKAGGFAAEGYALGIEAGADRIGDAMDSTFRVPADSFGTAAASGIRSSQVTITIGDIIVQGGNTAPETVSAIREELRRSLRADFVDLLEQGDAEATA